MASTYNSGSNNKVQVGALWFKEKPRPDGTINTFYSGRENERDRGFFMFKNNKGPSDWNLFVAEPDEKTGQSNFIPVGELWNKTKDRTEGRLLPSKKPIVGFRSKLKAERLETTEAKFRSGVISSETYDTDMAKHRRMPDISIFLDDKEKLDSNKQRATNQANALATKVTPEEEKAILLSDESIDEDFDDTNYDGDVPY